MKNLLSTVLCLAILSPNVAYALSVMECEIYSSLDSNKTGGVSCNNNASCRQCNDSAPLTLTKNGVITTHATRWTEYMDMTCGCDSYTTYECASGYYGEPISATAGCTPCPSNATCNGDTNFSCNRGYYSYGTICLQCPSSGDVYGATASTGATEIGECYLPADTKFNDESGSGIYADNCYYN